MKTLKNLLIMGILGVGLTFGALKSYGQEINLSYEDSDSTKIFLESPDKNDEYKKISVNIYFPNDFILNFKNNSELNNPEVYLTIKGARQEGARYKKRELKKMFKDIKEITSSWPAGEYTLTPKGFLSSYSSAKL